MAMYMTDKEIRFLWRNRGCSERKIIQCIADLNGCQYKEARDKCEELGLFTKGEYSKGNGKHNKPDAWTEEQTEKLLAMRKDGHSVEMIAEAIGRTPCSIKSKIDRLKMYSDRV